MTETVELSKPLRFAAQRAADRMGISLGELITLAIEKEMGGPPKEEENPTPPRGGLQFPALSCVYYWFDRLGSLTVPEIMNSLRAFARIMRKHPTLKQQAKVAGEIAGYWARLEQFTQEGHDAARLRVIAGHSGSAEHRAGVALWRELLAPLTQWPAGKYSDMFDCFHAELICISAAIHDCPNLALESGLLEKLVHSISVFMANDIYQMEAP